MSFPNLNQNNSASSKNENAGYMQQAQNIWSMLDDMAASSPKAYKDFIDKTIKEGKEVMKPPDAHMCVQASLTNPKRSNLYINFFSWKQVSAPKTDYDAIPIYGQKLDKTQKDTFINIAFNPNVLELYGKNGRNPDERDMLINLAFDFIEKENKVTINRNTYEVAQTFTCYGDQKAHQLKFQNALKRNNNDITNQAFEAMASDSLPNETVINKFLNMNINSDCSKNETEKTPAFKNLIEELNAEPAVQELPKYDMSVIQKNELDMIEIKVYLDKVQSMSQCNLSVDDNNQIILNTNDLYDELVISFEEYTKKYSEIEFDNMNAKFVKTKSLLKILLSFKK